LTAVRAAIAAVLLLAAGFFADAGVDLYRDPPEAGRVVGLFLLGIAVAFAATATAVLLVKRR
jgi:hypothetical protein